MTRVRFHLRVCYPTVSGELVAVSTAATFLERTARRMHAWFTSALGSGAVEWWGADGNTAVPPVRDGVRVLEPMRWEDVRPPDTDVRDPDIIVREPDNSALFLEAVTESTGHRSRPSKGDSARNSKLGPARPGVRMRR